MAVYVVRPPLSVDVEREQDADVRLPRSQRLGIRLMYKGMSGNMEGARSASLSRCRRARELKLILPYLRSSPPSRLAHQEAGRQVRQPGVGSRDRALHQVPQPQHGASRSLLSLPHGGADSARPRRTRCSTQSRPSRPSTSSSTCVSLPLSLRRRTLADALAVLAAQAQARRPTRRRPGRPSHGRLCCRRESSTFSSSSYVFVGAQRRRQLAVQALEAAAVRAPAPLEALLTLSVTLARSAAPCSSTRSATRRRSGSRVASSPLPRCSASRTARRPPSTRAAASPSSASPRKVRSASPSCVLAHADQYCSADYHRFHSVRPRRSSSSSAAGSLADSPPLRAARRWHHGPPGLHHRPVLHRYVKFCSSSSRPAAADSSLDTVSQSIRWVRPLSLSLSPSPPLGEH